MTSPRTLILFSLQLAGLLFDLTFVHTILLLVCYDSHLRERNETAGVHFEWTLKKQPDCRLSSRRQTAEPMIFYPPFLPLIGTKGVMVVLGLLWSLSIY